MLQSTVGYFYAYFSPKSAIGRDTKCSMGRTGKGTKEKRLASTASEYPLATFFRFRSLARNYKITSWDIPNPYEKNGGGHG